MLIYFCPFILLKTIKLKSFTVTYLIIEQFLNWFKVALSNIKVGILVFKVLILKFKLINVISIKQTKENIFEYDSKSFN